MKLNFKKIAFLVILLIVLSIFIACGLEVKEKSEVLNDIEADSGSQNSSELKQRELPYKNKKYAFGLKEFPKDFKVEQLGGDAGIVFKKWVESPPNKNLKDPSFDYTAEIYVMPFENIEDYKDLSEFVGEKYAGYTFEFADYDEFSGYYVNEGVALNAVSHFYSMSKNGKTIYEAYLKVPSKYYSAQKETFENMVKNIVFF